MGMSSIKDCCGGLSSEEMEFNRFDRIFSEIGGLELSCSEMEKLRFLELFGGNELSAACDSDGETARDGSCTLGRGSCCCC